MLTGSWEGHLTVGGEGWLGTWLEMGSGHSGQWGGLFLLALYPKQVSQAAPG